MIIQESFACQNGNYKLTCQCENTISSVFILLQSNRPTIWEEGKEKMGGGGRLPYCYTLATGLLATMSSAGPAGPFGVYSYLPYEYSKQEIFTKSMIIRYEVKKYFV